MGTRSLTKFYNKDDKQPFTVMCRQFDGYLDGHGKELAELLRRKRLINGIGAGASVEDSANGMGCLAAQVVTAFKQEAGLGGIYLARYNPQDSEDYSYEIRPDGGTFEVTVFHWSEQVFKGDPERFLAFCNGGAR